MRWLVLDTETTVKNNGNPFTKENRLCIVSYATEDDNGFFKIEYDDEPYGGNLQRIRDLVASCDIIIGFNLKFDLHWLRRYGIDFRGKRVWDCQLVHYLLERQTALFPSLNEAAERYNLGVKDDKVAEYWDRGIDTPEIPLDVLGPYAVRDAVLTGQLFHKQLDEVVNERNPQFKALVSLHNADLLVLQEMEWNGLLLDVETCKLAEAKAEEDLAKLTKRLEDFFGVAWVNWDSPKQLSALLYGGSIERVWREPNGVFKSGKKIGQERFSVHREVHEFRQLVKPSKGTELVGGGWSTSEDNLRSLKPRSQGVKDAISVILDRSGLEKLRGTYYKGLPELISEMGWEGNYLHGQINQCVARTGRTTSSKPNMQNLPPAIDQLFRSRFEGGQLVGFDAKGLEWVCIVYQAQDPVGIEEVNAGVNQHEMNRERFGLPDVRVAKYFVFRLLYGGLARTFTRDPDFSWVSTDEGFWQDVVDKFYEKYARIAATHREWFNNAIENGLYVTDSGREFVFSEGPNKPWEFVRPVILNYPVQSFGADLMAIARVVLFNKMQKMGLKSLLVNTIHDCIVVDIYPGEWYNVSQLVKETFDEIPEVFEKRFGKPFNLKMRAEAKSLVTGEKILG
jgi:DNA polymerase I-like protein with 3'-5' exonuclease and polymerase domains